MADSDNSKPVRNGRTYSAAQRQRAAELSTKHGRCRTPEWQSWSAMKSRCNNQKADQYAFYGGRGIIVCERWLHSFENFYADMGPRPEGTTLERKDNNANYEPGNCYWATFPEQVRNRRSNVRLTFQGETMILGDWSARIGLSRRVLDRRLKKGWSIDRVLATPARVIRTLTLHGETMTVAEWSKRTGVPGRQIRQRLDECGWSVEKTLTTPREGEAER